MKCSDFHDLAAGYALDALGDDELSACELHLATEGPHDGCEALLGRYRKVVEQLGHAVVPLAAPAGVWPAVEARVSQGARSRTSSGGGKRIREVLAWAAAAAGLLAALYAREHVSSATRQRAAIEREHATIAAQLEVDRTARSECESALAQLMRGSFSRDAVSLLEHPATQVTPMGPTAAQPYRATTLYNPETKRALVISTSIAPPADQDYQLWIIAAGAAPRAAGFLRFDPSNVAYGEFDASLLSGAPPAAFAVSLEPKGGRPTPSEVVLLGKVEG
jgi:anti-sigma-K factor RskA